MNATTAAPVGLPTGTVTFLFSDLQGSTQLLKDRGGKRTTVKKWISIGILIGATVAPATDGWILQGVRAALRHTRQPALEPAAVRAR